MKTATLPALRVDPKLRDAAERALRPDETLSRLMETALFPFSCRKAAAGLHGPRLRETVISFEASGYVALFEIEDASTVTVTAIRHQRESDYH